MLCENCSESPCSCLDSRVAAELSPFTNAIDAIWHNPEKYDMRVHGPRALKAGDNNIGLKAALIDAVATMRVAAFVHQNHHWTVSGPEFYSDHKLFEQLYEESQDQIDELAEKAVSVAGVSAVDFGAGFLRKLAALLPALDGLPPVKASLAIEERVLGAIGRVKGCGDPITAGIENLLDDICDNHESFQYLLGQRDTGAVP